MVYVFAGIVIFFIWAWAGRTVSALIAVLLANDQVDIVKIQALAMLLYLLLSGYIGYKLLHILIFPVN